MLSRTAKTIKTVMKAAPLKPKPPFSVILIAELSGELSGEICLKTFVSWVVPSNLFRKVLGAVRANFWLWGSFFLALDCREGRTWTIGVIWGSQIPFSAYHYTQKDYRNNSKTISVW